jgi:hypothetical protein
MNQDDGGEAVQRLLQALADAEAALTGPGPQAPRQAVQVLAGIEKILQTEICPADKGGRESLRQAQHRLERIRRMVEFGAAYWGGLVSCSVAAEAYGPGSSQSYGASPTGDLHG